MAIILRLDRVMADRKISLNELAKRFWNSSVIYKLSAMPGTQTEPDFHMEIQPYSETQQHCSFNCNTTAITGCNSIFMPVNHTLPHPHAVPFPHYHFHIKRYPYSG